MALGLTLGLGGTAAAQETDTPGQETGETQAEGTPGPETEETGTPDAGVVQSPITTIAAIREPEEIGQGVGGFWIHLAARLQPYEASVADRCELLPWSDLEAMAFEAVLFDRTAEPDQLDITVFLHDAVDITGGDLFVVNEVDRCEGEFLALELEQIGADNVQVGPRATDLGGGAPTTEGDGPGMGVPAAVAALLGGGWLARRLRESE